MYELVEYLRAAAAAATYANEIFIMWQQRVASVVITRWHLQQLFDNNSVAGLNEVINKQNDSLVNDFALLQLNLI